MDASQQDIPEHFLCPITLSVMRDPVIDNEGVSYEKEAIIQWLNAGNMSSPTTGKNLTIGDLRPNRALREAIEVHLGIETTVSRPATSEMGGTGHSQKEDDTPPTMASLLIDQASSSSQVTAELDLGLKYDGSHMLVSIVPPESTQSVRSSICCVVDVSGSMGAEATIQNENGETETFGLSVLDVTKHALKTIVKSLTPNDEFSLVSFCSTVEVELEPRLMTEAGAQQALDKIDSLREQDMTNLWGGLKKGLDLLTEQKPKTDNVALFLLTDGLPNIGPAKGEAKTLDDFKRNNKGLPCRINTFGFGYNMNSIMLSDLSSIGGGSYSFIPDSSFVGTVFVNAIANHITTAAYNLTLEINGKHVKIEKDDQEAYGPQPDEKHLSIPFGSIQYGQSKNVVFPLKKSKGSSAPELEVTLKYTAGITKKSIEKSYDWSLSPESHPDIQYHRLRLALVRGIDDTLSESDFIFDNNKIKAPTLEKKGQKKLKAVQDKMKQLVNSSEDRSKDLMKDMAGQIAEAFSKNEYFFKWGAHFCLSIKAAHLYQFCNNFKDPGVQHYCSELFSDTRDKLDNIFITLPAPKPSRSRQRFGNRQCAGGNPSPVRMSAFMNVMGGCFLGSSQVHLAGQGFARADRVSKGDKVITGSGQVDEIECVLRTVFNSEESQELVYMNENLVATPWHPVKGEENEWVFPAETNGQPIYVSAEAVYTFLLKKRGTILIGNTECATLAHGLSGDIIEHEFLGTELVAADLRRFDGYADGIVEVTPDSFKRDPETGRINAIRA